MSHTLSSEEKRRLCKGISKSFNHIKTLLDSLEQKNKSNDEAKSARNIYLSMKLIKNVYQSLNGLPGEK